MKYTLTLFLVGVFAMLAGAQGMQFESSEWSSILKKASRENKLIYLDAYTTWCGPCKLMKKNTFPDEEVGTFFNKNFVNAAFDMERGEGVELAKKYNVQAYPTHLVINGSGELVHRGLGYMDAEDFLIFGKAALDPEQQVIGMVKRFEAGDRDEAFLRKYINSLADANDPFGEVVTAEYLKTQRDMTSPANFNILYTYGMRPSSVNHKYILDNKEALTEKYKTGFLSGLAFGYYGESVKNGKSLDDAVKEISKVYPAEKDILAFYLKSNDAQRKRDNYRYEKELMNYLTDGNYQRFSYDELNSFAWFIFENSDNKAAISQAVKWAEHSVAKTPEYANYDTLAQLYAKAGKKSEAKSAAQKAIELGKASGEDTSSTEELLQKL